MTHKVWEYEHDSNNSQSGGSAVELMEKHNKDGWEAFAVTQQNMGHYFCQTIYFKRLKDLKQTGE